MDNVWERAKARYAQTPAPEELSFAAAPAIRTGSRRRRRKWAIEPRIALQDGLE